MGEGDGRERLVALGGADVGQAAGRQRPGGAELVGRQGGQWVAAAQRRVGDAVAQGDDAGGVELPAAGVGIEAGEQQARRHALQIAQDRPVDVAAEDVVAVAGGNDCVDIVIHAGGGIAGNDAVGDRSATKVHENPAARLVPVLLPVTVLSVTTVAAPPVPAVLLPLTVLLVRVIAEPP